MRDASETYIQSAQLSRNFGIDRFFMNKGYDVTQYNLMQDNTLHRTG
jgi:hypothetical protein